MLSFNMMFAAFTLLGLTSTLTNAYVLPGDMANGGVNNGAGDSFAAAYLIQIDVVDPDALLQNAKNPKLDYNLGLLRLIADESLKLGPYTVTNVSVPYGIPPNNDAHSYYSWAPYWWPDENCAFINTTEFMTRCRYVQRDGMFNPDLSYIRQKPAFINMAADTVSLALASQVFSEWRYLEHAANEIRYYFLDEATFMRPNFDYTQIRRGTATVPWAGVATGVLDARWLMYVTVTLGILTKHVDQVLPGYTQPIWTSADEAGMRAWMTNMTHWFTTAPIAVQAGKQKNNHATWYYAQAATYAYFGGNSTESARIIREYLNGIYQTFFAADGSQPNELSRTRPFHYSLFNLEPHICIAKLGDKVGVDVWGWPSRAGNMTTKKAVDFLIDLPYGDEDPSELAAHIMSVRGRYGDEDGKYERAINFFGAVLTNPPIYPLWQMPLYAPPTSSAVIQPANSNGWIVSPAHINVTARDNSQSGVRVLMITGNNQTVSQRMISPAPTHSAVLVMPDGEYTLTWCSENEQGDREICTNNTATVKVDTAVPVISFSSVGHPTFEYEPSSSIDISCHASDATSGIATSECYQFTASASSLPLYPAVTPLSAWAVDRAGNSVNVTVEVKVRTNLQQLCQKTMEYISPFNQIAAKSMCGQLDASVIAATANLRNMILDAYIVQAQICRLNGARMEQVDQLVVGARSLKH